MSSHVSVLSIDAARTHDHTALSYLRCSSGLSICCTNPAIARLVQIQMDKKMVDKLYLARVKVSKMHTALRNCKLEVDHLLMIVDTFI